MSNFNFGHIIKAAEKLLKESKSDSIRNCFNNIRFIEGIQQPKNILRTITHTRYRDETIPWNEKKPGLYAESKDPRCDLCKLGYIKQCTSFQTSNGI